MFSDFCVQPPEVQFTEEEEAIRLYLMENEPLPPEILENILSEWWHKEPIRYLNLYRIIHRLTFICLILKTLKQ